MYGSNMEHDCFQHMTNTGLLQPPGLVDALNHWHCFLLCQLTAYSVIKTVKQLFPSILWKPDSPETIFYDSPNPVNSLGVAILWHPQGGYPVQIITPQTRTNGESNGLTDDPLQLCLTTLTVQIILELTLPGKWSPTFKDHWLVALSKWQKITNI